jgi:hypothetical protein
MLQLHEMVCDSCGEGCWPIKVGLGQSEARHFGYPIECSYYYVVSECCEWRCEPKLVKIKSTEKDKVSENEL